MATSKFFSITVDELLSGDELLILAEEDSKQKETHLRDLVFGLLDCSIAMLSFLPFFAQKGTAVIQACSLLSLTGAALYLKVAYWSVVIGTVASGILTLALQNCAPAFWERCKNRISLFFNLIGAILFVISLQPYAATFLLIILVIKALMLIKWQ